MMRKFYLSEAQVDYSVQGNKQYFDVGRKIPDEQIETMRKGIHP